MNDIKSDNEINKEMVYDEQISPLMKQIIEICKSNGIPVFADFQFGPCDFVTTISSEGSHFVYQFYSAISQCKMENNGVNVDKLIAWLLKHPNKSSAYLHLLGNKVG